MKQVLSIFTRNFDGGYDVRWYGFVWNWTTMTPDEIPLPDHPKVSNDFNTLEMRCFQIYMHNKRQESIRSISLYDTCIPCLCSIGDTVIVNRGRLVPIGTIAQIISIYYTGYGMKVKLRDSRNEYTTYIKNLEVIAVSLSRKPREFEAFKIYPEVSKVEKIVRE